MKFINKKLFAVVMAAVMVLSLVGVESVSALAATKVYKVEMSKTKATLLTGKTTRLKTTVYPTTLNKTAKVTWSTSNKKVATVSSKGLVKAVTKGTATITAVVKVAGKTYKRTSKVVVTTPVSKVTLNKTSTTLYVGSKFSVKAAVAPTTAGNKGVTFTSSNGKVATVTTSGVVTAKAAGSATITVKAKDGSGKKVTLKVVVKEKNLTIDKDDLVGNAYTMEAKTYDNIRIASNVGTASISLKGVTVRKKLILESDNSYAVTLDNSTVKRVEIVSPVKASVVTEATANRPRLIVAGKTNISLVAAFAKVEFTGTTTGKVKSFVVAAPTDVVVSVPVTKLQINKNVADSNVVINAHVVTLRVNGGESTVTVNKDAVVEAVVTYGAGNAIVGTGSVEKVAVKGDNTVVNTPNTVVTVAEDTTGTKVNNNVVVGGTVVTTPSTTPSTTTPGTGTGSTTGVTVTGQKVGNTTTFTLPTAYTNLTQVNVVYGSSTYTVDGTMLTLLKSFLGNEAFAVSVWNATTSTTNTYNGQEVTVTGVSGSATKTVTFGNGPLNGKTFEVTVLNGNVTVATSTGTVTFSKSGTNTLIMEGTTAQTVSFVVSY